MIVLTDKTRELRQIQELPKQASEFEALVQLKNHSPFEILFDGIESKQAHYFLGRAMKSDGEIYVVVIHGRPIPAWVRFFASKTDFSPRLVLERVNRLKGLLEGSLNYIDLMNYTLEAPMEELVLNCSELGVCKRAIVTGFNDTLRRKFIMCDLLEVYLKERGELQK